MNDQLAEELGALESIYPDIIKKEAENQFELFISPDLAQDAEDGVRMKVLFPETYPDEAPMLSFRPFGSISDYFAEEIQSIANEIVNRSLGSAMIFDIIEGIREYLTEITAPEPEKPEEVYTKVYDTFTAVSLDSFLAWKKAYDEEAKENERIKNEAIKNDMFINGLTYTEVWSKPTGRQLFEGGFEVEEVEEVKDDEGDIVA